MGNGKKYVESFFSWVWRITGLIVLLLVLYGAVSIVGAFRSMKHLGQAPDGEATIGRLDRPDQQQAALKLGGFEALPGTSMLYAQLGSEGPSVGSLSSSFTPTDLRNLLFFDTASRQARWLLDDNAHLIAAVSVIGEPNPFQTQGSTPEPRALGLLFSLVRLKRTTRTTPPGTSGLPLSTVARSRRSSTVSAPCSTIT